MKNEDLMPSPSEMVENLNDAMYSDPQAKMEAMRSSARILALKLESAMSDCAEMRVAHNQQVFKFQQERENARQAYEALSRNYHADTISLVAAERDQLLKDKARLDWCDKNSLPDFSQVGNDSGWDIRSAIDAAIKAKGGQ